MAPPLTALPTQGAPGTKSNQRAPEPGRGAVRLMAQSGVLRAPRVQLIRGLACTIETANLSAGQPQHSATSFIRGGSPVRCKLIPTDLDEDGSRPARVLRLRPALARSDRDAEPA